MRRTYRKKKWKPDKTQYRANERIRIPEVQVIDQDGNMLGVMPTREALEKAREAGFDLVEVNPTANPSLARFMDYGKIQYEREKQKQKHKAKMKKVDTKGVRLSMKISDHDRNVRVNQALKFIDKGHKVKVELIMRGRENKYKQNAIDSVKEFITDLQGQIEEGEFIIENAPKKEGNRITALVSVKS